MADRSPDDPNEDVLRQMKAGGDDLSKERDVDFSVIFGSEDSARRFCEQFQRLGYEANLERSDADPDCPWDVTVVKALAPTSADIAEFERMLELAASPLGGRNDGWGCFRQ